MAEQIIGADEAIPSFHRRVWTGLRLARRRTLAVLTVYASLQILAVAAAKSAQEPALAAFTLGLTAPGAGFLLASPDVVGGVGFGMAALAASLLLFGAAMMLWFATGNVVLPPLAWISTAITAGFAASSNGLVAADVAEIGPTGGAVAASALAALILLTREKPQIRPLAPVSSVAARPMREVYELSADDLRLTRLLLDRALQPIECFDGFEWRDQFQTAAIRKNERKNELAANAIERPNTIWIRRRKPPEVSPKARLSPVAMITMTATIFATGPSIDSRIDSSGASHGIEDPAAWASTDSKSKLLSTMPGAAPSGRSRRIKVIIGFLRNAG